MTVNSTPVPQSSWPLPPYLLRRYFPNHLLSLTVLPTISTRQQITKVIFCMVLQMSITFNVMTTFAHRSWSGLVYELSFSGRTLAWIRHPTDEFYVESDQLETRQSSSRDFASPPACPRPLPPKPPLSPVPPSSIPLQAYRESRPSPGPSCSNFRRRDGISPPVEEVEGWWMTQKRLKEPKGTEGLEKALAVEGKPVLNTRGSKTTKPTPNPRQDSIMQVLECSPSARRQKDNGRVRQTAGVDSSIRLVQAQHCQLDLPDHCLLYEHQTS
ncbi:hypothetical protein BDN72DRAFT_863559 [Pluteus cervinus]|uniref:Uncharacterized protein n=1 Tax=Pluteus cervinus TaxID=181527 RepID=A0ACD3A732_9AGAR|nr:hypothetical protein BDN72DRAFT_863559 [Pluteus cervinus]